MMKVKLHDHLIENITRAIGDSCETENHVIMKVIEHVSQTTRHSIEPGVELVGSLEKVFRDTLAHAVRYASALSDKYGARVREAAARRVMGVDIKITSGQKK